MNEQFADSTDVMRRAVELAMRGIGWVEPNPPVGAVLVDDRLRLIGEGFHERFGGAHAEINALGQAERRAAGATLFVTLEPCCHHGKTPPCTTALINAGVGKVVVGIQDPALHAGGKGIAELRQAGIEVDIGLLAVEVTRLSAPFVKRVTTGTPYVHAKWAMTLDGKIATSTGESQWITNASSREIVHALRGRADAIVIGLRTAVADDPLLTARPPGPRTAVRIVIDSRAELPTHSKLVQTVDEAPVLIVAHQSAPDASTTRLRRAGVEVLTLPSTDDDTKHTGRPDLLALLKELGRREMTNILVEGGAHLLGSFFDQRLIDECHVFVAPKLVGGTDQYSPVRGRGMQRIADALELSDPQIEIVGSDVYIHGPLGCAVKR